MTDVPWVDGKTFGEVLTQTETNYGNCDAMVFDRLKHRWTYQQFHVDVMRTAQALIAIGVEPGCHVGIWSTNLPQWVLMQFATAQIGAVLVNINPAYRPHELDFILKQADIHTLVLTDRFKQSDYERMAYELIPGLTTTPFGTPLDEDKYPHLRHVISVKDFPEPQGIWPWQAFVERASDTTVLHVDARAAKVTPDSPVNIQFTSGTTGAPKGAVLTHRNLLLNAYYVGQRMHITEADRVCIPVPFYHCFGCVMGTLMCAVHGAAMVIPAESFDPEATLETVAAERCTALYGVPTMFSAEVHHPRFDEFDLTSLRTGIMAGSPCPIELMKQVATKMHLGEITIAYGLTEASPVITQTQTDEPLEVRTSTVGKALPGVDVRLVEPGGTRDAAQGDPGELWTRSNMVMQGYYKRPDATAEVLSDDGWLKTGDLALQTPEGHYRITGRIKDMIIRGGENIYPREIEEFLLTHPTIRDVQVVGMPDTHYGEQVSAWIVRADDTLTEDEVRAFCKENIAHYKVPHYIRFVEEFPLTVTGKVQKFKLREMGIEEFGLQDAASAETA